MPADGGEGYGTLPLTPVRGPDYAPSLGGSPSQSPRYVGMLDKKELRRLAKATTTDRFFFFFGVMDLLLTTFVVARCPEDFWILHVVKAVVLLSWRFVRFRERGYECYLFDFCYFAEYATVLCCALAYIRITFGDSTFLSQYNPQLVRAGFALSSGPLAWSVLIFRNSLVFHDPDHMTSVFIHFSPPLFFWCLRFGGGLGASVVDEAWPGMFHICQNGEPTSAVDVCVHEQRWWCDACPPDWSSFLIWPLAIWLGWALLYWLVVLVLLDGWIERNGKDTLFRYVASSPGPMRDFIHKFPPAFHKAAYLFLHFSSTLVFGAFGALFWKSFMIHSLFLVFILSIAVWNGASYIFKVFAMRYAQDLLRKQDERETVRETASLGKAASTKPE